MNLLLCFHDVAEQRLTRRTTGTGRRNDPSTSQVAVEARRTAETRRQLCENSRGARQVGRQRKYCMNSGSIDTRR